MLFHAVPTLWRLHRMHHTDLDVDVTTVARFHSIEIILSMLIKLSIIVIIGAPPESVLIFEILLNAVAMFNHSNLYLPTSLDKVLHFFVVTPDMHRVHHSDIKNETDSNFGFNIPWWDRIFGTYKEQPKYGYEAMNIGFNVFRDEKYLNLHWMLIQPFQTEDDASVNTNDSEKLMILK